MNMTETTPSFTAEQIGWYRAYEKVRKGGRYNMFDPRARKAAKLTAHAYSFVMSNFSALRKQADA